MPKHHSNSSVVYDAECGGLSVRGDLVPRPQRGGDSEGQPSEYEDEIDIVGMPLHTIHQQRM